MTSQDSTQFRNANLLFLKWYLMQRSFSQCTYFRVFRIICNTGWWKLRYFRLNVFYLLETLRSFFSGALTSVWPPAANDKGHSSLGTTHFRKGHQLEIASLYRVYKWALIKCLSDAVHLSIYKNSFSSPLSVERSRSRGPLRSVMVHQGPSTSVEMEREGSGEFENCRGRSWSRRGRPRYFERGWGRRRLVERSRPIERVRNRSK